MKKKTIKAIILSMAFTTLVCGCNNYDSELNTEHNSTIVKDDMLHFSNKEMLFDAVNNPASVYITRSVINPGFKSLMDEVDINEPELSNLTLSERAYIVDNNINYYEAFDYEDLIPNEKFAQYLNCKAEICCNDTVYKVTEYGTLAAHEDHQEELESIAEILDEIVSFNDNENEKQLSSNVKIINSFHQIHGGLEDLGDRLDDGRDEGGPLIGSGSGSGGSSSGNSTATYTNTPLEDIPFSSFPSFSSGSHTFVGKLIESLFGERSTKEHEFMSGYRVKGSMYDYDYGVYHECGVYVSMQRKRGGFFRFINGWKNIDADELVMDLEGMVLALKVDIPHELSSLMPPKATVNGYDNTFNYWGKKSKCVNIIGYDIKEEDIYNFAGKGLSEALKALQKMCNQNIDDDVKAAQIITPNKAFIILLSHPLYAHNQHKIRKVFDSGVRIGISFDLFANPTAPNTFISLFKFLQEMPRVGIVKGVARLAVKHDTSWGGMIITK